MKTYIKPSLILVVLIVLGTFVFVGAQQNQNNFNGSSGTGSGTVSANNGSAGAIANYASGGGSTTVGPDANLVDAANLLTYSGASGFLASAGPMASGANGGVAGIAKLFGSTSGSASLTAPPVAGTVTNPVTSSNIFAGPDGTSAAATYGFTSCASCGVRVASGFAVLNGSTAATLQAAGVTILDANSTGLLTSGKLLWGKAAPTISSGFGSTPSIVASNGTGGFTLNVGTGGVATSGVIGLATATTGWTVQCTDLTTTSATVFITKQTATTTSTATIGNFNTSATAAAWAASDVLSCQAFAY